MKDRLRTADIMKVAGVGRNTLRFYEQRGLISALDRTESGYRVFSRSTLDDLEFIKQAKAAGLALDEIKALLDLGRAGSTTCEKVSAQIEAKVVDIDVLLLQLREKKNFLLKFLETCKAEPTARCDVRKSGFKASACCG